ncbi:glycosyltransferase family 4 protein [Microbacterium arborescens]|uniref:glycosyltransferase family 4 protein n=1 Tax=Microbacterium arborescens TaxID=33883 RepID=UPI0025A22EA2|nr:glycosyltransferase family 1 protein [Microbacterium arborescens]WJM15292.1 glycosyltransferase family 1 protein [Microbacterium arborescens]
MRLLFDGFWWVRGPLANQTVMREFVHAWSRAFPGDELLVAIRRKHVAMFEEPEGVRPVTTRLGPQAVSNAIELPLLARLHRADFVVSHNYAPITGRSLVFIHDLLFEDNPQWFSLKERVYFSPMAVLARRASIVATSSETEAARMQRLHRELAPVLTTGLGVSSGLTHATARRPAGLPEVANFVLSVGRLNARKNLATVIAGAMRSASITANRPLVIVGSAEYSGAQADLPPAVAEFVSDGRLIFLGRVSDGELRWLYERADCLIYMSLDEGYGLPPAEALHFGAPVIASDIAVMRETVGRRGALVPPDSAEKLAAALERIAPRTTSAPATTTRDAELQWERAAGSMRAAMLSFEAGREHNA